MKKILTGSVASLAAGALMFGAFAVPASAKTTTVKVDPVLLADTHQTTAATIGGAGSTFDLPLFAAAQPFFTARDSNATITDYPGGGSGAGQSDVTKGLTNWGASDVPLNQAQLTAVSGNIDDNIADWVQVPVALGGEAMAYNLPQITKSKTLSKIGLTLNASIIARIYNPSAAAPITMWNDPAICKLNPKLVVKVKGKNKCALPADPIITNARSDSSGTTFIFTNYLNAADPTDWPTAPAKTALTLPSGGLSGNGNGGVAANVAAHEYSIGYIEYSYLALNKDLVAAKIINKAKKAVAISPASVAADAAQFPSVNATTYAIVNGPGATSYPISGYSWAIILKNQADDGTYTEAQATLLVDFLDWLSHSAPKGSGYTFGQDVAGEQGYVPLPANIQTLARTTLNSVNWNGTKLLS